MNDWYKRKRWKKLFDSVVSWLKLRNIFVSNSTVTIKIYLYFLY